jgi:hypothetical protein
MSLISGVQETGTRYSWVFEARMIDYTDQQILGE